LIYIQITRDPKAYHKGFGPIWSAIVFATGILPLLFAITGLMMWLRGRRTRAASIERVGAGGGT
jgi:hypothetical protein